MAVIRPNRRIERAGVNALRALLEDHDQLVQEIDGGNDHGEDLYVSFTRNRRRTGHIVAIQVKSGKKYRRAHGYAIPVDDHFQDWRQSKVPVLGVVYDSESESLYWVNLTKFLGSCNTSPGWVEVPLKNILDAAHIRGFIAENEIYIDSAGMRIRNSDPSRSLEQLVQSERAFDVQVQRPDSGELPNPLFDGLATIITRLPISARQFNWGVAFITLLTVMLEEWPYQIAFVKTYSDLNPIAWVMAVYCLIIYLFMIVFFERLSGRLARNTERFLALVAGNFLWIPFIKGNGIDDKWWGDMWIGIGAVLPNVGIVALTGLFVRAEIERRKK